MLKKIILGISLLAAILALNIAAMLFFHKNKLSEKTVLLDNPKVTLQYVIQQLPLSRKANIVESEGEWKEKGYNFPTKGFRFTILSKDYPANLTPGPDYGIYKNSGNTLKDFEPLIHTSQQDLFAHGFLINKENTRLQYDIDHQPIEQYEGFEKGYMKCIISSSSTSYLAEDFFCGQIDQKQVELQQSVRDLFDTKNGDLRVTKIENDFATGTYNQGAGYGWIAKKSEEKWQVIERFQSGLACSEIKKYSIPPSIYNDPSCQ
ncbi:MAG TPA: hypothetical protein VLG12_04055 [Candidatus Saccharimonadales bacterium]|nr:hypothetical protein [Candidatus Saccharimonadales bacterium]